MSFEYILLIEFKDLGNYRVFYYFMNTNYQDFITKARENKYIIQHKLYQILFYCLKYIIQILVIL